MTSLIKKLQYSSLGTHSRISPRVVQPFENKNVLLFNVGNILQPMNIK